MNRLSGTLAPAGGYKLRRYGSWRHEPRRGDLADIIGVHYTHVSRYERNLAAPSIDIVKKICEALDVSSAPVRVSTNRIPNHLIFS